jgi:hypothetical protein
MMVIDREDVAEEKRRMAKVKKVEHELAKMKAELVATSVLNRNEARRFHRWLTEIELNDACRAIVRKMEQDHPWLLSKSEETPNTSPKPSKRSWPL